MAVRLHNQHKIWRNINQFWLIESELDQDCWLAGPLYRYIWMSSLTRFLFTGSSCSLGISTGPQQITQNGTYYPKSPSTHLGRGPLQVQISLSSMSLRYNSITSTQILTLLNLEVIWLFFSSNPQLLISHQVLSILPLKYQSGSFPPLILTATVFTQIFSISHFVTSSLASLPPHSLPSDSPCLSSLPYF